jgi:hypothetical protein
MPEYCFYAVTRDDHITVNASPATAIYESDQ